MEDARTECSGPAGGGVVLFFYCQDTPHFDSDSDHESDHDSNHLATTEALPDGYAAATNTERGRIFWVFGVPDKRMTTPGEFLVCTST